MAIIIGIVSLPVMVYTIQSPRTDCSALIGYNNRTGSPIVFYRCPGSNDAPSTLPIVPTQPYFPEGVILGVLAIAVLVIGYVFPNSQSHGSMKEESMAKP
jgi:hypothetical protein